MKNLIAILLSIGFILTPIFAFAQKAQNLKLSITPPLIKNKVEPGQVWKSSVKLVNNNDKPLTAYMRVADFRGKAESGTVRFLSREEVKSGSADFLLSEWINLETEEVSLKPHSSKSIPFIVEVPEAAAPGGHYAAILAGTQPPKDKVKGATIRVSSLLASLMLLSVEGEVQEAGRIREFSTDKSFYTEPEVEFSVRFQNTGNIHVQPQGEIRVYDQWGDEQGVITINHRTEFGNVLPEGTRKWEFDWTGEKSLLDMGRYRADLVLGYGEQARHTANRSIHFWVVYVKPLVITLGSIFGFLLLLVFFIRLYVRRAIARTHAQLAQEQAAPTKQTTAAEKPQKRIKVDPDKNKNEEAVVDLKRSQTTKDPGSSPDASSAAPVASWRYFKWFLAVLLLVVLGLGGWLAAQEYGLGQDPDNRGREQIPERAPAAEQAQTATNTPITKRSTEKQATSTSVKDTQLFIRVLNGSGESGVAGRAGQILEDVQYKISEVGNAESFDHASSTLFYARPEFSGQAGRIAEILPVDPVVQKEADQEADIVLILGRDFADKL